MPPNLGHLVGAEDYTVGSTSEAAHLHGVNPSRIRQLLSAGRIIGARKHGRDWELALPLWLWAAPVGPESTLAGVRLIPRMKGEA